MCRNISKKPPKEIYGIEIMPEAVELFDKSVAENNLSDRIKPVLCDLKDPQGVPREYFDIVTVNPPYWKKVRARSAFPMYRRRHDTRYCAISTML